MFQAVIKVTVFWKVWILLDEPAVLAFSNLFDGK